MASIKERFIVTKNWIDKIYMFTEEIFGDVVDNKIHKYATRLPSLWRRCLKFAAFVALKHLLMKQNSYAKCFKFKHFFKIEPLFMNVYPHNRSEIKIHLDEVMNAIQKYFSGFTQTSKNTLRMNHPRKASILQVAL